MSDQILLLPAAGLWTPAQLLKEEAPLLALSALVCCTIVLKAADWSHTGKDKFGENVYFEVQMKISDAKNDKEEMLPIL